MNTAEWILVAILSIALITFLVVGIVFLVMMIGLITEAKKVVIESQDIAKNANGVVNNLRGMTSIGGTVESFINHIIVPKLRDKFYELMDSKKSRRKKRAEEDE